MKRILLTSAVWLQVLHVLFFFYATVEVFALVVTKQNTRVEPVAGNFPKVGVTSLLVKEDGTVIAGTKNGKILCSEIRLNGSWTELQGYKSKFPVYSMVLDTDEAAPKLFCGGGDRYISVWKQGTYDQRLGPHTGWVKDLQYDEVNRLLYSIGCNCIETWGYKNELSSLTHLSKRSIENSPDMGATLSSDLLCLSLLDNGYLAAGGVDGRLHLWLPGYKVKDPVCSIRVHDGRVNALLFAPKAQLLFSTGHDGCLHTIRSTSGMLTLDTSLLIEGSPRLTAAGIINDENESVHLALGSADGWVVFVKVEIRDNESKLSHIGAVQLRDSPMIHSLLCVPSMDSSERCLLVGHAAGLTQISLPSVN
jgi:WD40 repeat protein